MSEALTYRPSEILTNLRSWVQRQSGITFSREQEALFAERIAGLCRDLKLSPETLHNKLTMGDKAVALRLLEAASTNYTFFFREPEIFSYLVEQVFPALPEVPLRFWSAAASSGDEAYSLAICAREYFGESAQARLRILGTDISDRQVRIAEQGTYPKLQLAQLGDRRLARWFTPALGGQLRIAETIRQMCTFRRLNLAQRPWPFEQRFHVIFLRNVLYYFEPPVREQLLEACYQSAEPGAVLITSLTEPMVDVKTRWRMVRPAVFVRAGR
jgi:chemotaxis protein methyltransferase CheR